MTTRDVERTGVIRTERMRLIPATSELIRMEMADRTAFESKIGARIPDNWPPQLMTDALPWFAEQLESDASLSGWLCWYGLLLGEGTDGPVLAASGGFMGKPMDRHVETGYSVLPQFQGRGIATEMVGALSAWAFSHPAVTHVVAEVSSDNTPSLRLLRGLGFKECGPGRDPGHLRYENRRDSDAP